MTRPRWADIRLDELTKEFDAITRTIGVCNQLLTIIPHGDPDAIATVEDLRRLRAKRDEIKAELLRLEAAQQSVSCATH